MNLFVALVSREIRLAWRIGGGGLLAVTFFLITVTMIPFGVGPETGILSRISAGVVWVAALLAVLLSLDRLFQADFEDGSLDHLALSPLPVEVIVLGKCLAHWLTTGLPVVVAAPVMAILLNMNPDGLWILMVSIAIGTPALSLIGAIGAALTVGLRRGGLILSLLVMPLYVPTLIFGALAVEAVLSARPPGPLLLIEAAITLFTLVISPLAAAAALRLNLS